MALFRRPRRLVDVSATLGAAGFTAAEAPALQRSLVAALHHHERADGRALPGDLEIGRGAGDHLVVIWRNLVVGFVPPDRAAPFEAVLPDDPRAGITLRGVVHQDGGLWRVWVGDPPADGFPPPPAGLDTLPVPPDTLLGIPLPRRDDGGPV